MSSVARAATPSQCFDSLDHHASPRPVNELGAAGGGDGDTDGGHWNTVAYECEIGAGPDGSFDFVVEGGSDNGEFPFIGGPPDHHLYHRQLQRGTDHPLLSRGDILLEIHGQKVAGYTQRDIISWLGYCARTCCTKIRIKAVKADYLTKDLRHYLNARFQKGSLDHDLQNTIRDNLYLRTVPCTTRSPRCGEINGVDYTFLTVDEFVALERSGNLLESGIYEGNLYGTPRPAPAASAFSANASNVVPSSGWVHKGNYYGSPKPLTDIPHSPAKRNNSIGNCNSLVMPGPHASSEGKRRRNRSNVEAMASKTSDASEYSVYPPHTRSSTPVSNLSNGIGYKGQKPSVFSPVDQVFLDIPQNLDQSCSDGYYFGHNTSGSSLWHDPRAPALPRTSLGDPCDNDLPFGWERIDDPHYGTYYIDHVNRRTQYENPVHIGPDSNLVNNKMSCRSLSWYSNKSGQRSDNSRSTGPRSPGSEIKTSPRTSRNSSLTQTTNCSNTRDSIIPTNANSESLLIEGHPLHSPLNSLSNATSPAANPLSSSPAATHRFPYLHCIPCLNEKHDPPKHPLPSDATQPEGGGVGLVPNGTLANNAINKKPDGEPLATSPVILPGSASSYRTVDSRFTPSGTDSACRDFSKPSSLTGLITQPKRLAASFFTRNPEELKGTFLRIPLVKSSRGLGFTIVGGSNPTTQELLQIKDVVPYGPAWCDGQMQTGDVLVYVNGKCVLGYTHNDIISQFQSIPAGEIVELQICRGYPLPFDPSDPNTEIVTTVAVSIASAKGLDCQNVYSVSQADNPASMNTTTAKSADLMTRATKSMPDLSARRAEHNGTHNFMTEHSETFPGLYANSGAGLPSYLTMDIVKGTAGFGFTIADSCYGQKVKKILDRPRCKQLQEGDVLAEINGQSILTRPHAEVVQILKECPCGEIAQVSVQRGGFLAPVKNKNRSKVRNSENESKWNDAKFSALHSSSFYQLPAPGEKDDKSISNYRSKTPTAELYSSRDKDPVVVPRPKTPLVDSRNWAKSSPGHSFPRKHSNLENHISKSRNMDEISNCDQLDRETSAYLLLDENKMSTLSLSRENSNQNTSDHNDRETFFHASKIGENSFSNDTHYNSHFVNKNQDHIHTLPSENRMNVAERGNLDTSITNSDWKLAYYNDFSSQFGNTRSLLPSNGYPLHNSSSKTNHIDPFTMYKSQYQPHLRSHSQNNRDSLPHTATSWNDASLTKENCFPNNMSVFTATSFFPESQLSKKHSTSFEHEHPMPYSSTDLMPDYSKPRNLHSGKMTPHSYMNMFITLHKQNNGFGFRIVGGTEEGSQASVGHIVPAGAADLDGRLRSGDEILGVDGNSVVSCSHRQVVQLMNAAGANGKVTLHVRRPNTAINGLNNNVTSKFSENVLPYDVTVTRNENEGFGFVLISSVSRPGSTIGRLIEGSPADRCGQLRVGDVIQAVNGINILHMHHGDIVSLIKDSGYSVVLTITHPQDDSSSITSASQKGEESSLDPDDSFHSVELHRGTKGFGFSIRGGREFHNMPLFILRIAENGAAHQDGRLQVGDQIVEINGVSTKNMTHAEAIELIRAGGSIVRLLIKRNSLSFSAENANVYHHLLPSTSESPPLQVSPNGNETACQTSQQM